MQCSKCKIIRKLIILLLVEEHLLDDRVGVKNVKILFLKNFEGEKNIRIIEVYI